MIPLPPIQDPLPEMEIALKTVIQAGEAILDIYKTNFNTDVKSDDSPITEADLKSNQIIRNLLGKSNIPILSEEDKDDKSRLAYSKLWVVDPLDGTSDFVNKTGEFTVMIGLVKDKMPILGIINWPVNNTIFIAQKGGGAFRFSNGSWESIRVSQVNRLENCKALGSRNHLSNEEKEFFNDLGIREFTSLGSSLKVGKISSGEAEIYFTSTNKIKEWDTCASYCIILEAGGNMTDIFGKPLFYNNENVNHENGILVTNGLVHDMIVKKYKKLD